jgi:hypothetical protein
MEMPHYKVDGILLFRRDELDAWLEHFREEPTEHETLRGPSGPDRRPLRTRALVRQSVAADVRNDELPKTSKSRAPPASSAARCR